MRRAIARYALQGANLILVAASVSRARRAQDAKEVSP
jgi:hypothetical protein